MRSWIRISLFAAVGAAAGLAYYHFFGCTGSCPITSDPFRTMAYMGVVGLLLGLVMAPEKKSDR